MARRKKYLLKPGHVVVYSKAGEIFKQETVRGARVLAIRVGGESRTEIDENLTDHPFRRVEVDLRLPDSTEITCPWRPPMGDAGACRPRITHVVMKFS